MGDSRHREGEAGVVHGQGRFPECLLLLFVLDIRLDNVAPRDLSQLLLPPDVVQERAACWVASCAVAYLRCAATSA